MHRALLALLWAAATLAATAVSWVGVSTVTAAVSDTPSPAIPPQRVIALVEPSSTTTTTEPETTTSTAPAPVATTTTAATRREEPATTTTTVTPPRPTTTSTTVPRRTATYNTKGGSITVACDGDAVGLVSAAPADGYQVVVDKAGPDRVDVSFRGEEDGSRILAHCEEGTPVRDQPPPPPPRDGRGGPGPGGRH